MSDRVILTGASGFLGHYIQRELEARDIPCVTAGRAQSGAEIELDLSSDDALPSEFEDAVVLHAAAMSSMGGCKNDPDLADRVNADAPRRIAERARRMLFVSTDLVFGGDEAPYLPEDSVSPLSAYGRSKVRGEEAVLSRGGDRHIVVRLPLLFGPSHDGTRGATDMLRRSSRQGTPLSLFQNEYRTPLHVGVAARALVDLLFEPAALEVLHVAGDERLSRTELAERFLTLAEDIEPGPWTPVDCEDPERPRDVSLTSDLEVQPDLDMWLAAS